MCFAKETKLLSGTHINLQENSEKVSTTVTTSVPMNCTFDIINPIVPSLSRIDVVIGECSLTINGPDSTSFNTIAVRDFVRDGNTNLTLKIQPRVGSCNLNISDPVTYTIEVSVEDFDGGRCNAASDPHYRSFDGRYYNWYQTGTIIVHQNLYRDFEVHGRAWNCWSVSCLCGVVIREGDDVASIDMCDGQFSYSPPKVKKLSHVTYNEGFKIYRDSSGRRFTVTTPSGSSVTAVVTRYWITAIITVPSDDFGNSNGSCGYFDGNSTNDFLLPSGETYMPTNVFQNYQPSNFTDSWSDSSFDSLFNRDLPSVPTMTPSTYCKCMSVGTDEVCSSATMVNNVYAVFRSGLIDITDNVASGESSRRRRSTGHHIQKRSAFEPTRTNVTNETLAWPSNGITEQNATDNCNSTLINSEIYAACKDLFENTDDLLNECVEDIQLTGSFDSVNDILERFQSQCETAVVNNYNTSSGNFTDDALVVQLESLNCPGQCSGYGNCTNGMCSCNDGFEGDDCSVNSMVSPELFSLNDEKTLRCDVRNDACENISAIGGPFTDNGNLKCQYAEDGDSTSISVSASFENFLEIKCQFGELVSTNYDKQKVNSKASMWLNVRVSTGEGDTRKSTGPGLTFIVYDPSLA
ncbi:von Willebrand factor D and EGF domain-containing protein-like [Anneissia japonica]|uniref:von Willebrand factor D and EGF domain-containing protein-like n=1 Tax=Anneissia japonica TaxID=1529436 RepID=UPI001425B683|nr:von Willebrand factor D and EGF domain-containing protein-like [Anneissia japonica]